MFSVDSGFGLDRFSVDSGFGLDRLSVYPGFYLDRFPCITMTTVKDVNSDFLIS